MSPDIHMTLSLDHNGSKAVCPFAGANLNDLYLLTRWISSRSKARPLTDVGSYMSVNHSIRSDKIIPVFIWEPLTFWVPQAPCSSFLRRRTSFEFTSQSSPFIFYHRSTCTWPQQVLKSPTVTKRTNVSVIYRGFRIAGLCWISWEP